MAHGPLTADPGEGHAGGEKRGTYAHARDDREPWRTGNLLLLPLTIVVHEHLIDVRELLAHVEGGRVEVVGHVTRMLYAACIISFSRGRFLAMSALPASSTARAIASHSGLMHALDCSAVYRREQSPWTNRRSNSSK